ncbi:hypothetical protein Bca52824_004538 [Brassica carinata]|uniref:Uncharacterized protein n=1 Tax=Brassica carinata TaxID=52824 RepID=A0A8X7WS89_BRACI|nr:hypothetical protein Bca52824_004538 [Brassica carinata]
MRLGCSELKTSVTENEVLDIGDGNVGEEVASYGRRKFPKLTQRLRRPAVALVSTNGPWITFMKLRLDRSSS